MIDKPQEPITYLRQMEAQYVGGASGLPQDIDLKVYWSGIGFKLGQYSYVAPLGEVVEIVTYPGQTRIPMTQEWVKGVANIRGNLIPIMDLRGLLMDKSTAINANTRVLVVHHNDTFAGFVVEEVMGIRHFSEEERTSILPSVDDRIRPYLRRAYWQRGEYWGVFSMFRLVDSPAFMQVAV